MESNRVKRSKAPCRSLGANTSAPDPEGGSAGLMSFGSASGARSSMGIFGMVAPRSRPRSPRALRLRSHRPATPSGSAGASALHTDTSRRETTLSEPRRRVSQGENPYKSTPGLAGGEIKTPRRQNPRALLLPGPSSALLPDPPPAPRLSFPLGIALTAFRKL